MQVSTLPPSVKMQSLVQCQEEEGGAGAAGSQAATGVLVSQLNPADYKRLKVP